MTTQVELFPINIKIPIKNTLIGMPTFSILLHSSLPGAPWKYANIRTDGKIPTRAIKLIVGRYIGNSYFSTRYSMNSTKLVPAIK